MRTFIDDIIEDAIPKVLNKVGGLISIRIFSSSGDVSFNSINDETASIIENIRCTPVSRYERVFEENPSKVVEGFECYVMSKDLTVIPKGEESELIIHSENRDGSITNYTVTIRKVYPVPTGGAITMYRLVCKG